MRLLHRPRGIAPVIAVAFVAAGFLSALTVRSWWPFRTDHAAILARAWTQAFDARAVRTSIAARAEQDGGSSGSVGIPSIRIAVEDILATARDDGRRHAATIHATIAYTVGSTVAIALERRTMDGNEYLQLTDLTVAQEAGADRTASAVALAGAVKAAIGGRWVLLDAASLPALADAFGVSLPVRMADGDARALADDVRAYLRANSPLVLRDALGSGRAAGVRSRRYRVGIRPEVLRALLDRTMARLDRSAEERASALERFDVVTAPALARVEAEAWIAKRDGTFVELRAPFTLPASGGIGALRGTVEARWTDWNAALAVEPPTDAVPIASLLGQILDPATGALGGADADRDGLSDLEEIRYRSNPNNPDTDGDGYTDGEEVRNGYSPVGTGRLR